MAVGQEVRRHTVSTVHISQLIKNGLRIAQACDGHTAGNTVPLGPPARSVEVPDAPVDHALAKAAADLRHAAEELEAERLSCLEWPQV